VIGGRRPQPVTDHRLPIADLRRARIVYIEAPHMSDRILLTFATGKARYGTMAKALAYSARLHDTQTPFALITDSTDPELLGLYPIRLSPHPRFTHWFSKLAALDLTNAQRVLFVDGDCLALRNLDSIFDVLDGNDFAVQGLWREEVRWYGDMTSVIRRLGIPRIPLFSGGFLYYERTDRTCELIERIMEIAADYDGLGLIRNGGQVVDEVCISLAMAQTGIGTVFPDRTGLSMTPWGLRGRVHLDVLRGECTFVKGVQEPRLHKPFLYHSAHAGFDLRYWRQVNRVLRLFRASKGSGAADRLQRFRKPMRALVEAYVRLAGLDR
jgi:hypothetical protein